MRKSLRAFWVMLAYGIRADPWRAAFLFAVGVVAQVAGLSATYGIKPLTDAVLHRNLSDVTTAVLVIALSTAVAQICLRLYFNLTETVREKASLLIDREMMALSAGIIGIEHHERPEYLDEITILCATRELFEGMTNAAVMNVCAVVQ